MYLNILLIWGEILEETVQSIHSNNLFVACDKTYLKIDFSKKLKLSSSMIMTNNGHLFPIKCA